MPKNKIHKRKDGRWTYSVTDINGKSRSLTSRRKESKKDFSKRCDDLDSKASFHYADETMDELFNKWVALKGPKLSESYIINQTSTYKNHVHPYIGHLSIYDIKMSDVYELLALADSKGYSREMISCIKKAVSAPYNFARASLGYEIVPPTDGLVFSMDERDEIDKTAHALSIEDTERLLKASRESKYFLYVYLQIKAGLRPRGVPPCRHFYSLHKIQFRTKNQTNQIPSFLTSDF